MGKRLKLKNWLSNLKGDILNHWKKLTAFKPRELSNSTARIDEIFHGGQIDIVLKIIENAGFDYRYRITGYANLYKERVVAQLHPCHGGIDIVVRETDEECPECTVLKARDISDLSGYKGPNKAWLDGNGTRWTYRPAVAYTAPIDLIKDPHHEGWEDVKELLRYAHTK